MPSPPPRKVKPTAWLKEIHAKQLGSLQQREQQLLDIIEDVRSFAKQRADIERLYGQSLLKISAQLLAKKELFNVPGEEKAAADGNEHKSVQSAWKCCLEETEKLGSSRMKAADVYNQTVSERCKVLKSHKQLAIRKALEQLNSLQADLTQSVKEFGVEHKQYTDDEVIAYEARNKANTAGQRLANKETGVFSSVNTLKKSQAKTFAKMEEANAQSASSRNGYLLQLTAVNAHTGRMHSKHIPSLFKSLDDGVYDELSSCISVIGQTEINTCNTVLSTHNNITSTCALVTPQFNLDCFLQVNPVFSEQITFAFEPVQNDTVSGLSIDYGEDQRLEKETRNWARKVARETRTLADLHDQINQVTNKGVPGDSVLEVELGKLHACVRRSEVAKLKAEARLDLLRTVNMPVDEMLTQATSEHESLPDNQSFTSRGSTHSGDTFDSFSDHQSEPPSLRPAHLPRVQEDTVSASRVSIQSSVIAIYDYKASQPDELTLTEGEVLSIIDHGTGDGWLRASNSSGVLGLVPENYIETYEQVLSPTDTVTGYMTDNATPESQSNIPHQPGSLGYVRALYDYQADGLDELSFSAGQVITLLSRDENGIDDGYWKGEIEGVQGMFPSLVVEEIENPWSSGETTNTQEQAWHAEAAEQHWAEENTAVQEPVKQPSAPHSFSDELQLRLRGRKMLSEAANDSPAVTGAQPMKRQAQKSETAV
ncbi:F-BAR and double SH3 domains protein 2-like isoform X2 [Watersipora subatra]|uniref:F-BAR and double SH3 domains protein 2-like isoform X2 n=1 Tax=Watersipora subatra TaxID=2589382 RepID=UPI00355AEFE5